MKIKQVDKFILEAAYSNNNNNYYNYKNKNKKMFCWISIKKYFIV